jgi:transcriptional regulator with XRE-family HTH domain
MPKHKHPSTENGETFGQRLARLRKVAGYSQPGLAREIGISKRMVIYYEKESSHPPTHLLTVLAKALGVTTDQLLGVEKVKENRTKDIRLWRRFTEVEKLSPALRKHIAEYIDNLLEKEKLLREKQGKA